MLYTFSRVLFTKTIKYNKKDRFSNKMEPFSCFSYFEKIKLHFHNILIRKASKNGRTFCLDNCLSCYMNLKRLSRSFLTTSNLKSGQSRFLLQISIKRGLILWIHHPDAHFRILISNKVQWYWICSDVNCLYICLFLMSYGRQDMSLGDSETIASYKWCRGIYWTYLQVNLIFNCISHLVVFILGSILNLSGFFDS